MNTSKTIFIANWKMQFSYNQSVDWLSSNRESLKDLSSRIHASLVICPSFDALSAAKDNLKNTGVSWGAQDCSAYQAGSYTGQISATSLVDLGCSYCIIGHSEKLRYGHETIQEVRHKLENLITTPIIPILCLGETEIEYRTGTALTALEEQITVLLTQHSQQPRNLIIAYEPHWAIGTGKVPAQDELIAIAKALHVWGRQLLPSTALTFIYGGSVSPETAAAIKKLHVFDGFLIGKASLDFQTFEKIVLSE